MIRLLLLISVPLLLASCERKNEPTPSKLPATRPELKVNLKEKIGQAVEVTGLLVKVSTDETKQQDKWIGETTATLECKGMTLTCRFPGVTKAPIQFAPGIADMRLVTIRGTVVSVEPEGTATLIECVVVSDPASP